MRTRRSGIPVFVPPGHGLVYLAGHHLARSALFTARPRWTVRAAVAAAVTWAALGLIVGPRPDVAGALAMLALVAFLWHGRDPVLFAAMLVVIALLEFYGTGTGSQVQLPMWPGFGLPAGNPPSGVAAGYCVFDALALLFTGSADQPRQQMLELRGRVVAQARVHGRALDHRARWRDQPVEAL
jgi:hypothetical protein